MWSFQQTAAAQVFHSSISCCGEGHPVLGFFFLVGVRTAHVVWAACVKSVRFGRAPLQQRVPQLLLIEFWLCKRIIRLSVASVVEQLCTCKVVSCTFLS
jgi:hypothetical protein